MEKHKFTNDVIIELAVTKGYHIIPTLETSVNSVVHWLWSTHKLHIYTKIIKNPNGELFFYYCVQDFGHERLIDKFSISEDNGDKYMFSWAALHAGLINILNRI